MPLLEGETLPPRPIYAEGGIMEQETLVQGGWKLIRSSPRSASFQTKLTLPRMKHEWLPEHAPELIGVRWTTKELNAWFDARFKLKKALSKYLWGPFHELYYLPDDPLEENDLAAAEPERVEALTAVLDRIRERAEDARAKAAVTPPTQLTDAELDELRSLGYIGDDDS